MQYWSDGLGENTIDQCLPISLPSTPLFHYSIIPRGQGCSPKTEHTPNCCTSCYPLQAPYNLGSEYAFSWSVGRVGVWAGDGLLARGICQGHWKGAYAFWDCCPNPWSEH